MNRKESTCPLEWQRRMLNLFYIYVRSDCRRGQFLGVDLEREKYPLPVDGPEGIFGTSYTVRIAPVRKVLSV
jgi:hypothetical protein